MGPLSPPTERGSPRSPEWVGIGRRSLIPGYGRDAEVVHGRMFASNGCWSCAVGNAEEVLGPWRQGHSYKLPASRPSVDGRVVAWGGRVQEEETGQGLRAFVSGPWLAPTAPCTSWRKKCSRAPCRVSVVTRRSALLHVGNCAILWAKLHFGFSLGGVLPSPLKPSSISRKYATNGWPRRKGIVLGRIEGHTLE